MDTDHAGLRTAPTRDAPGWLLPWLDWLDAALHREILRLRSRYELSTDELRGLYVSDEQVDRLVRRNIDTGDVEGLAAVEGRLAGLLAETGLAHGSPIGEVAQRFRLADADVVAVVLCLAPEVDLTYQTLYAYLNDDIARRLPTVDLCRRLSGVRLEPDSPSVDAGLLEVHRQAGAPLWRSAALVLAEPARRHLLAPPPGAGRPRTRRGGLVVLAARLPLDADAEARAWADRQGRDLLRVGGPAALASATLAARLADAALHVPGELHGLCDDDGATDTRRLVRQLVDAGAPVLLSAPPDVADRLPLDGIEHERVDVEEPDAGDRQVLWSEELLRHGFTPGERDLAEVAALYRLSPAQVRSAVAAVAKRGEASRSALGEAARRTSTAGLRSVAQRVEADYSWDDLVLPAGTLRRLRQLEGAIRHRDEVFGTWAFGRLVGGHTSVRALFAGPSGTGKTMTTAVLGAVLGMDVFRVDLSSVVSKYIGETEKNLERILKAAEHSNAILLFDEADALFGKRSEVKDAHDRYANIEVAFLLQRLESFDGIVVLATNLAANLDEAFSRRLHFTIEFPTPDEAARLELWRRAFPAAAPVADDVDVDFLAGHFAITGGEVRAASLMAAFLAATDRAPISMTHVVRALARLRRQHGRLPSAGEFGVHLRAANDGEA